MNVENLKLGIRDFVAFAGIITTILVNYYALRSDIRDIAKGIEGDRKIYELRINLLEADVSRIKLDIERLRFDNLEKNENNTRKSRH